MSFGPNTLEFRHNITVEALIKNCVITVMDYEQYNINNVLKIRTYKLGKLSVISRYVMKKLYTFLLIRYILN